MNENMKAFHNLLIEQYKTTKEKEAKETDRLFQSLYRDKQRKIEEIYQKNFHKSIDNVDFI